MALRTMTPYYYHVDVRWNKERQGMICSPELHRRLGENGCIEIATPPEFPKGVQGFWSPEHLFTASVGSCFMTTFLAIAENSALDFSSFSCRATGKLDNQDGKLIMTEVALNPQVTINNSNQESLAVRVMEKAEKSCLITSSIKTTVTLNPTVLITPHLNEQAS